MQPERQEYEGHSIDLREREGERMLLIDDVPVQYGQLPDGSYFLYEYAYDWSDDLMDLGRKYIGYRLRAERIRRERESGKGGK